MKKMFFIAIIIVLSGFGSGCSSGGAYNPKDVVYKAAKAIKNDDAHSLAALYLPEYKRYLCKGLRLSIRENGEKAQFRGMEFTAEDAKLTDEELIVKIASAQIKHYSGKPWVEKCLTEKIDIELIGYYVDESSAIYDKPGTSIEMIMDGDKWYIKTGM